MAGIAQPGAGGGVQSGVKLKLFVMMVLQFFIWGAWLPLVFPYMGKIGFTGDQQA
ncbi:MAG: Nucleoside symporter, partial [Armatimonadetes bacterium]|nr:Nucleoside symporter [Armatimonadota bacterium]